MEQMKRAFETWNHEGFEFPVFCQKDVLLGPIKNFEVRDDDVWLCTYPKSGTHWLMQILNLLNQNGDLDKVRSTPQAPGPLELSLPGPNGTVNNSYEYYKKIPSPRLIVTHLPRHLLPVQVFEKKAKVIYVARNPKDVAVSSYHFIKPAMQSLGQSLEWCDFLDMHMSEKARPCRWSSHVLPFWEYRNHDNVLFLKFEDLKTNPLKEVTEIANHIGKEVSDNILKKVVENSSVKKTKEIMDSESNRKGITAEVNLGRYVRRGVVGDWKTHFTVAQNKHYDTLLANELKGSGLVMQFE